MSIGLLLVLAGAHFSAVVARILPGVVAGDLQSAFGLNDAAFGLVHGPAFVGVYVIGLVVSAALVDRVDRYKVMAGCILVWTVASLACAAATSIEALVIARVCVGLGQAAFAPCAMSLIIDRGGAGFGKPLSVFSAGSALGRSGGLLLGGAAIAALAAVAPTWADPIAPWRLVYALLSLPGLLFAALLLGRRDARPAFDQQRLGLAGAVLWAWRRRAALGPHLVAACAAILLTQSTTAWMPSVFQRAFGVDPARAAVLAGIVVLIAGPLGHLIGGVLVDRLSARGRPPADAIVAGLAAAAVFGLLLGSSTGEVGAALAYAGLSLALGVAGLAALAGLQPLTPSNRRGSVTSLFLAAVTLVGLGLGPPLVGLVSQEAFPTTAGLLTALSWVIVASAVVGAAAAGLGLPAWRRAARLDVLDG